MINGWIYAGQVAEMLGLTSGLALLFFGGWFGMSSIEDAQRPPWFKCAVLIALATFIVASSVPNRQTILYSLGVEHGPEILDRVDQRIGEAVSQGVVQ